MEFEFDPKKSERDLGRRRWDYMRVFETKQVARIPSPRLLHPEQATDFEKEVIEAEAA